MLPAGLLFPRSTKVKCPHTLCPKRFTLEAMSDRVCTVRWKKKLKFNGFLTIPVIFTHQFRMNVNRFGQSVCGLETVVLRGESMAAGNRKINANFLFGGFIASYESLCVNEHLCFVSTALRELTKIKNFVYPLCVIRHAWATPRLQTVEH